MAYTFNIGESDSPIKIIHHVGAPVPKDGRFYSVQEQFIRKIWVDGEEKEEISSYVTYMVACQPDTTSIDKLRVGYTHKAEPEIVLDNRRLEVV